MSRWTAALLVLILQMGSAGSGPRPTPVPHPQSSAADSATPALDYDFFKARVESIFLKKRPTHAQWYVCHEDAN